MNALLDFYSFSLDNVRLIYEQQVDPHFEYHNLRHTLDVLAKTEEIGSAEGITSHELTLVKIAALYHDTGFARARKNHEELSVQMFLDASKDSNLSLSETEIVCGCIRATRMPQSPQSHLEEIVCDADLDYLGRTDFFEIGDFLRNEMLYSGELDDANAWNVIQLKFLENHQYRTNFSKQTRQSGLMKNIHLLKVRIQNQAG